MGVGAADVLAVIGRLLSAAHADKAGLSTVGADAQCGLKGWGGHERSVSAPPRKSNRMTRKSRQGAPDGSVTEDDLVGARWSTAPRRSVVASAHSRAPAPT